ncbi:MAG: dienelactone hydrolase family protein [Firmicutes bacterium]|nr:dienelactone hydrolase family protein [Bacillota bacterium]
MNTKMQKSEKEKLFTVLKILGIILVVFLLMGMLLKNVMFPPYDEPVITGSLTVKTMEFTWEDESRVETFTDTGENRALTVKFWYPEEEGSYPLVVFSHGAFGVIDSNYSTCKELASNGYVVASIAHPYHAMYVKDVNGKTTYVDMDYLKGVLENNGTYDPETERGIYERSIQWMELRVADENFVLDTILDKAKNSKEAPFMLIDAEKIGLFGHSMGGACSVQLGRERDDIDAVIDLEGTMLGEYVGFENGIEVYNEEPYPVPVLDVNGVRIIEAMDEMTEVVKDTIPDWQYVNFYLGEHAADYKLVLFHNAGHLNFTDLPLISPVLAKMLGVGEVDAKTCIENVNEVVLNWFDYYLKGKETLDIRPEY